MKKQGGGRNASIFKKKKINPLYRFKEGVMPAIVKALSHKFEQNKINKMLSDTEESNEFIIPNLSKRELKDCKLFLFRVQLYSKSPSGYRRNQTLKLPNTTQRCFSPQPIIKNVIVKISNKHLKNNEECKKNNNCSKQSCILCESNCDVDEIPNIKKKRIFELNHKEKLKPINSEDYVTPQNRKKSILKTTDFRNEMQKVQINRRTYRKEDDSTKIKNNSEEKISEEDIEHSFSYSNCRRLTDSERKNRNKKESSSSVNSNENCGCKIKIAPKKNLDSQFTQDNRRKQEINKYRKTIIDRFRNNIDNYW